MSITHNNSMNNITSIAHNTKMNNIKRTNDFNIYIMSNEKTFKFYERHKMKPQTNKRFLYILQYYGAVTTFKGVYVPPPGCF